MFTFVFFLFLALQVAALVGGVVTRAWPMQTQQIVWRGTTVDYAARQIQALLYDVDDVRFAYPTGQFVPDADESDLAAGRVVMHEANFKGSKGFGMVFHLFGLAAAAVGGVFEESFFVGFLMAGLAFGIAALLAAPFLAASLIDIVYRRLYRSRIDANVRAHPSVPNAVTVDLTFRGLSAFGIVGDVMRAAAEPSAPAGSRAAATTRTDLLPSGARASNWARSAEQRSTVVYASGVVAALFVALVLTLADPSPFSSSTPAPAFSNAGAQVPIEPPPVEPPPAEPPPDETLPPDDTATTATQPDSTTDPTPPSDAPGTYTSVGGHFKIVPPDGWLLNSEDKDHSGVFYETRWHKPGSSDVHALVDYTPGYGGTPTQGASSLRNARKGSLDYEELDFSGQPGGPRRWEYIAAGQHIVDTFYRCGETGLAVLTTAPTDLWDDEQAELGSFQDSFTCSDDASGTAESPTEPPPPTSGAAPPASAPASDNGQTYPLSTDAGRMERAIRHHWQARVDGDYATAYGFYTGAVRRRVGLESSWADQIQKDGLESVDFGAFHSEFASSSSGRLHVKVHTQSRIGGCDDWQFTYDMVFAGHRWLITDSKATDAPC